MWKSLLQKFLRNYEDQVGFVMLFGVAFDNKPCMQNAKQLCACTPSHLETCASLQVELLLTFEDYCSGEGVFEGRDEQGSEFSDVFANVRVIHHSCWPLQCCSF